MIKKPLGAFIISGGLLLGGAGCAPATPIVTPAPISETAATLPREPSAPIVPAEIKTVIVPEAKPTPVEPAVVTKPATTVAPAPAVKPVVKSFTVTGVNVSFSPAAITVKQGDTVRVTFINDEGHHDWRLDEFNAATKIIEAGQQETVEFVTSKKGSFEYYCSVGRHRSLGMKGTLIVE